MDVAPPIACAPIEDMRYLPGAWIDIDVSPPPQFPVAHRNVRAVHGLVTALLGVGHAPPTALFALAPWPSTLGWAAYVYNGETALRCAGQTTCADLFGRPTIVRCSEIRRAAAPPVVSGRRTVDIRTVTPVCLRRTDNRGKKRFRLEIDNEILRSNLRSWLSARLGVTPPPELDARVVTRDLRTEQVPVGGKLGVVLGLYGRLVVEVDTWALWTLRAAEVLGLGGRVGYGFGRIVVRG